MAAIVTGMGQVLIVCGVPGTQDFTHNNCCTLKVNILHVLLHHHGQMPMFTTLSWQHSDGGRGREVLNGMPKVAQLNGQAYEVNSAQGKLSRRVEPDQGGMGVDN